MTVQDQEDVLPNDNSEGVKLAIGISNFAWIPKSQLKFYKLVAQLTMAKFKEMINFS